MGYTTEFDGKFLLSRALTLAEYQDLKKLASDESDEGPGGYCQWVPAEDGTALMWDGNEKFYHYVDWLEHIIESRLKPWGIILNGAVRYHGEAAGDSGVIDVTDNTVTTK